MYIRGRARKDRLRSECTGQLRPLPRRGRRTAVMARSQRTHNDIKSNTLRIRISLGLQLGI